MALTDGKAPYAPAKSVLAVVAKHRAVGLPKVDLDILERIGVTEALRPRVLASLKLLDFYDKDGVVTPVFDDLKKVPSADFPAAFGSLLRQTYAPIIEVLGEPSQATPEAIDDAFRTFEPRGQLVRMSQLFTGLMIFAGIMPPVERKPGPKGTTRTPRKMSAPKGGTPEVQTPPPVVNPPVVNQPLPQDGHHTVVNLGPAGTVTLIVNVNPLALTKTDRTHFYGLVDALDEWRATKQGDGTEGVSTS